MWISIFLLYILPCFHLMGLAICNNLGSLVNWTLNVCPQIDFSHQGCTFLTIKVPTNNVYMNRFFQHLIFLIKMMSIIKVLTIKDYNNNNNNNNNAFELCNNYVTCCGCSNFFIILVFMGNTLQANEFHWESTLPYNVLAFFCTFFQKINSIGSCKIWFWILNHVLNAFIIDLPHYRNHDKVMSHVPMFWIKMNFLTCQTMKATYRCLILQPISVKMVGKKTIDFL
jgi:hypothetical protein